MQRVVKSCTTTPPKIGLILAQACPSNITGRKGAKEEGAGGSNRINLHYLSETRNIPSNEYENLSSAYKISAI